MINNCTKSLAMKKFEISFENDFKIEMGGTLKRSWVDKIFQ